MLSPQHGSPSRCRNQHQKNHRENCPKNPPVGPSNGRVSLNLYSQGCFGILKIATFEGSGFLGWIDFFWHPGKFIIHRPYSIIGNMLRDESLAPFPLVEALLLSLKNPWKINILHLRISHLQFGKSSVHHPPP